MLAGCGQGEGEPVAISLVDRFRAATVEHAVATDTGPPRIRWRFDGGASLEAADHLAPTQGWEALHGVEDLAIREGKLAGKVTGRPVLAAAVPPPPDDTDSFHAFQIEIRVAAGSRLGVRFVGAPELDRDQVAERATKDLLLDFNTDLLPGGNFHTYTLTSANARFGTSVPMRRIRHVVLRPTDASEGDFEIASIRLITLKEHLAAIPAGIGWQGLADVFRETVVSRSGEEVVYELELGSDPFLDLNVGTVENGAVTFRVEVEAEADGRRKTLLKRTITTPQTWYPTPVELGELAGRAVRLSLKVEADTPGTLGFWGSPVIRNRAGRVELEESSPARRAVAERDDPPQGVIVVIADTLRRDHLPFYGYDRPTAPVLTGLAGDGALFRDNISQGTWTKVSVSSILTSLYPATTGIKDMPDRLPAGVTTLAEAYRAAGFATFATSSVPFTGRLTNLHQGVEVLHEASSLPSIEPSRSKTSRTYTDRLLDWIEIQKDVPFFALLHVMDPHSPFEPYRPYESMFLAADEMAAFRDDLKRALSAEEDPFMRRQALPKPETLDQLSIDRETFVEREKSWYDASIRAMDVEIGRLIERLEELGLADRVVIAFLSDHGEEFLEHGRHFHGRSAYGEMLNVPLFLWGPGWLPRGVEIGETVQSIDLLPTLLEISRLPVPGSIQGQSLLPLLAEGPSASLGWTPRPAFAERSYGPVAFDDEEDPLDCIAIVSDGWKLIKNLTRPEGTPEYELFDHVEDPLNLHDLAAEHPEVVERLGRTLDNWHRSALAARLQTAGEAEMSADELEQLKALGYL